MTNFPDDETGQVLELMEDSGMDLTEPCDIEFSHLFDHESQARNMATAAEALGARVEVFEPEELDDDEEIEESAWDVVCTFEMVPTHKGITTRETELSQLAESLGGHADGWGVLQG